MKPRRYVCGDCGSGNIDWARCSLDNCDRLVFSRGWCKAHYSQWWRRKQKEDEKFKALDEAPIWEGVEATTRQRMASRAS